MEETRGEAFQQFAGEYFQRLVEGVAGAYGNKPADAVDLSPDEEVERWLRPTSPAALRALELGGSAEDARRANELWAHAMRGQQAQVRAQMAQGGATEPQIAAALKEQGLTDEAIAATCRRDAYNLGKQNSRNDPKREAEYHKKLAERARKRQAAQQQQQTAMPVEGGMA